MNTYFDIIPKELIYHVIKNLDYVDTEKILSLVTEFEINWKMFFKYKYPEFYDKILIIIKNKRFERYINLIWELIYTDLSNMKEYFNIFDIFSLYEFNGYYQSGEYSQTLENIIYDDTVNSLTINILYGIILIDKYPKIYNKLHEIINSNKKWHKFIYVLCYISINILFGTVQLLDTKLKKNFFYFINNGKLKDKLTYKDLMDFEYEEPYLYFVFYMISQDPLFDKNTVIYDRVVYDKDYLIEIFNELFSGSQMLADDRSNYYLFISNLLNDI